ncbi:MAG: hypothetical protein QOG89_615 [Thermomicrobiales bacterium]|nr:hypothetical protein [Thermomicrobiales bacterium]
MKQFGTVSRLIAVCAVLLALSGMQSGVFAQDADDTSAAPDTSTEVAVEASYSVGVSCWPVDDGSQTACSFSASASDGAGIEALWVPAWVACAEVVDATGTEWTGDGYHVYSNALTLTLAGTVGVGGGAEYFVRVNGESIAAGGDALFCDTASSEGAHGDEETPADGSTEPVDPADETQTEPDPAAEPDGSTDEAATDEGTLDEGTTDDGTPVEESTDTTPEDDGTSADVATDATPVDTNEDVPATPGPTGDGTSDSGSAPSVSATTDEPQQALDVKAAVVEPPAQATISVIVYNCATDPDGADLDAHCGAPAAVALVATNGPDGLLPQDDCHGVPCFSATVGTPFVVTETVPGGYQPIGNGSATIDPVTADATIVFVNVAEDGGDSQLGRLQLVHGSCPSSEPKDPKFIIIPPKSFQAAAEPSCGPSQAVLTINGGNLGQDGLQAVTDDNGIWRGFLPPGSYTVSIPSGTSPDVPVVADELTAVVVIDYSVPPAGSLTVTKIVCTEGDEEGTQISVAGEEGPGGPSCAPANGQFSLSKQAEVSAQASVAFSLGNDGTATMNLPVGNYLLTDLGSGESAGIGVAEGANTRAAVRTVTLHGTLVVRNYYCADPKSREENPEDSSYWDLECAQPNGGVTLTLADDSGNVVDTQTGNRGGTITWKNLHRGSYSVQSADGLCAAFVDGTDARDGFAVPANATTFVKVYTCAVAGNDGGGNNGGGDDDGDDDGSSGGDGSGGNGDGDEGTGGGNWDTDDADDADEVAGVYQLPSTGARTPPSGNLGFNSLALLALALPALLAGAALTRRRTS